MRYRRRILSIAVLLFVIVSFTQFCTTPASQTQENYLNHNDSAQYVGMAACAQCHVDKVQTFVHTGMGMSFDTVSKTKSSANLTGHLSLYDSFLNLHYFPHWRGEDLYVLEYRLDQNDTVYKRLEKISYIIGSGQHTNSHLIRKGDFVVQAPFTWYAQKGQLDFPPGFENGGNSRFKRVVDEECMSCHNGLPTMRVGSTRAFASIPKGIDCERCHGPGSIHVDKRRLGLEPDGDIDYSIVNPSKLSWARQIDVCQRCHLQGNNVLKEGKTFHDFKPGMILADVFEIYLPKYEGGGGLFNMANHADRFQNSQCFLKSNGHGKEMKLTCITCHNPHVSVKNTHISRFNKTCKSCHSNGDDCGEQMNVRMLKSDNCITCHMPISGTEDIPHVTVHDHKIGIYKEGQKKSDTPVVGLYSVNNRNPEKKTLIEAYLSYYEKFDPLPIYQQRARELLNEEEHPELRIHLFYQEQNWVKIVEYIEKQKISNPSDITCYRIGKAYGYTGQVAKAVEWLKLAVLKDEFYFEYKSDLASNLIKMNRLEEAKEVLLSCLNQFEEYNPALNNLGYLYIQQGQFSDAKDYLEKSLRFDPDNLKAKENMVLLYYRMNNAKMEVYWLREVINQHKNHKSAKKRLSQLNEVL